MTYQNPWAHRHTWALRQTYLAPSTLGSIAWSWREHSPLPQRICMGRGVYGTVFDKSRDATIVIPVVLVFIIIISAASGIVKLEL